MLNSKLNSKLSIKFVDLNKCMVLFYTSVYEIKLS
jgi:hypothetical protein